MADKSQVAKARRHLAAAIRLSGGLIAQPVQADEIPFRFVDHDDEQPDSNKVRFQPRRTEKPRVTESHGRLQEDTWNSPRFIRDAAWPMGR